MGVGNADTSVPCRNKYILGMTGQMSDVRKPIYRDIELRGPPERNAVYIIEFSYIVFKACKAGLCIFFVGRLMVFAAGNKIFLAINFLCPEIMIRFIHIIC